MKATVTIALSALLGGACLFGCGKSAAGFSNANAKIFASAPTETKAAWDAASAAIATNGFAAATLSLQKLQGTPDLTPEQLKAVNETVTAVSDQMYDKANKGDPAAKEAINQLRGVQVR